MIESFDIVFYQLINQKLSNSFLDTVMVWFSDKFFWIPVYVYLLFVIIRKYKKKSIIMIVCLILSVVVSDRVTSGLMKPYFKRIRPCHVTELHPRLPAGIYCSDTGSMASSHAANHFALSVFMILLMGYTRKSIQTWVFLIWAACVAYSRIYCGVHYPTDVLTGALLGTVFAYLSYRLYLQLLTINKSE